MILSFKSYPRGQALHGFFHLQTIIELCPKVAGIREDRAA